MSENVTLSTKFETLNTLESKGQWLGKKYRSIVNSDRKQITEFDLPLGYLMLDLRAEGGKQIKKARLQDCEIDHIAKQRRSDSESLARNWSHPVMQELVASGRFSATQTLLREFKKLTADEKPPVVKTAEQLVEELFKGMEKFDITPNAIQAAMIAKLASVPADENTQKEAA